MVADELDTARRRFPLGHAVTGRVVDVPRPGVIGLFVDLGEPPTGFADCLLLPPQPEDWPDVGAVAPFEVIQHRKGQVRLCPLGGAIPPPLRQATEQEWSDIKARHAIGADVTATVTHVFPVNREYVVRFGDHNGTAEWRGDEQAPTVGESHRYRVLRHLDSVRGIVVAPADSEVARGTR